MSTTNQVMGNGPIFRITDAFVKGIGPNQYTLLAEVTVNIFKTAATVAIYFKNAQNAGIQIVKDPSEPAILPGKPFFAATPFGASCSIKKDATQEEEKLFNKGQSNFPKVETVNYSAIGENVLMMHLTDEEAVDFASNFPNPDVILKDRQLNKRDARELLTRIEQVIDCYFPRKITPTFS